jgi:MFS family permease
MSDNLYKQAPKKPSTWTALSNTTFKWLWLATLISNIGSWMHEVGAGWLMTSLTSSTVIVALLQTATSLPSFFFMLPAGALGDIFDKRDFLLFSNITMAICAASLAVLTSLDLVGPWILLTFTFLLGVGMAMNLPTWQSIVPEIVPRHDLQGAIGLNTLGQNISRAIGPLIAGLLISSLGTVAVFICNAFSFIFIIVVLVLWERQKTQHSLPPENLISAIISGFKYARYSKPLQATIIRTIGFYFFASIMWSLLPVLTRDVLNGDEHTYSWLFSSISVGAITMAFLLPRLRQFFSHDQLINLSGMVFAAAISLTALVQDVRAALVTLALCGAAWISMMTSAQMAAQTALPNWIRSRGLAVFLTCFMGALAIGPVVWGTLAEHTSIPVAFIVSSVGLFFSTLYTRRFPVSGNTALDLSPSGHWLKLEPVLNVHHGQGPVLIQVHYRVQPSSRTLFISTLMQLGQIRLRDGATSWQYFEQVMEPEYFVELFTLPSWLDHLRQHERITKQDATIQIKIKDYLQEGTVAEVMRFIRPEI